MMVGALVACLLLSFVLSGLESAIFSVSIVRVRHRAKEAAHPNGKETRLERVLHHRQRLLTAVLLTNNALALVAFALATRVLVHHFGDSGYWIAFVVSLPVYVFGFELVPKSLFGRFPYRALRLFVVVLEVINLTVGKLLGLAMLLRPVFQEEAAREEDELEELATARAEFRSLAQIVARDGALSPAEKEMIENVMNFRRILAGQLMVPLADVTAIPLDMPAEMVVKLARDTGIDEFPVMSKSGDLVGIVNAFEILREQPQGAGAVNFLRRIVKVGRDERASSLVLRLRKSGLRVAAVCDNDPARTVVGIISIDDILQRMLQKS